jgi:hypothetical protein
MAASRIALWFAAGGTLRIVGVYLWGLFIAAAGFPFGAEIVKDRCSAIIGLSAR